jgi:glycosyltransferase involved in cell wall biosynthesis
VRVAFHAGQLLQPVPGGIGRYERALLRHIPRDGIEVVAFAAGPRPPSVARHVPWVDLGRPHGSLRYELWHRLRRPVVRVDADVVHAPSLAVPPTGATPLVVTVHDIAFARFPHLTTRRGYRFHMRGLDLARRDAAAVVAISEFTRGELLSQGFDAERVFVARSGMDAPTDRDDADVDAAVATAGVTHPYVLCVGTVEPRKDFPTAAAAVAKVRARHPALTLVIVGPPGWGNVTGLDRPFVRVLGRQPWPVLEALYRRATACCLPSRYEGFGLPALEALARGAPVITTTGSALEEVVGDAALLFAPGDVDGCAAALENVMDDVALRDHLARTGRARAEEFTWNATADAYVVAYRSALQHRP